MSGTAATQEYHLEKILKKMLNERDYPEIDVEVDDYPDQPLAYFIVQMDKFLRISRCPDEADNVALGRNL